MAENKTPKLLKGKKLTPGGYAKPGTGEGSGGLMDENGDPVMTESQKQMYKENEQRLKALDEARIERLRAAGEKNVSADSKAYGGKVKKMATGGSMPMVKKDGKMVPSFAADGVGKMAYGGKAMKMADGKMVTKKKKKKTTTTARRRGDGCAVRGKTKGRMV